MSFQHLHKFWIYFSKNDPKISSNALRRSIIHYATNFAITRIALTNITNCYQQCDYLRDQILIMLNNLSDTHLIISNDNYYHKKLYLKGPISVYANHLEDEVIRVNQPNHYLFTITKDLSIEVDLIIEKVGQNFKPNHEISQSHHLNYLMVPTNLESIKSCWCTDNYDGSITVSLITNNNCIPKELITDALHGLNNTLTECLVDTIYQDQEIYTIDDESIDSLGLSLRAYRCLMAANIDTLGKLVTKTADELLQLKNLGQKSLEDIINSLNKKKYKLKEN